MWRHWTLSRRGINSGAFGGDIEGVIDDLNSTFPIEETPSTVEPFQASKAMIASLGCYWIPGGVDHGQWTIFILLCR